MGQFDQTIGFTLMGVIVNTYLMGVIMSQFFTYWTSKQQDFWWIKTLVAFLFVINAIQASVVVYMSWFYCVTNFSNPAIVAISLWPYPFTALTTAVLALVFHSFQSWRIYVFTNNKILVGFLMASALAACGMGVAAAIQSWIFSELAKLIALQPVVEGNLSLQCALDVLIAVILSVTFNKSKTSFAKTDQMLNRLIRTAIQSGSFTAVFALGTVLSFRFSPKTYMIALFALPIGRIYTHTMMDHLITRNEMRKILMDGGNIISVPVGSFNVSTNSGSNGEAILMSRAMNRSNVIKGSHSDLDKEVE
ncbi:hypothetical protein GGX14DRAFT_84863 [Mycena pura]|uniref:DUF6534 domain-containing protein n=1 Tax=Mycena pura TaxID=153505 RepID=A0AAD6VII5_9AGAR|nr:hypothetical protein GGX14DRAFT_84863 [Mycena pura]